MCQPVADCVGDHYLAHSLGGTTSLENQTGYCDGHNQMKAALTPEQWEAQLKPLEPWNPYDRGDP